MRLRTRPVLCTLALAGLVATAGLLPTAHAEDQRSPVDLAADAVATAAGACDELDTRLCLLPFPNDQFTVLDPSTPTGRRVDLSPLATPRNIAGKPMDPTEWNRNDGFSPGAMALTVVPGLDLTTTFGLDPEPETGPGSDNDPFAVRDDLPDHVLEAPELSMAPDAPIVLLDADTGERHPYYVELDEHPVTLEEGRDRTLIIRPLVNFLEGHRYIVALRDLRDADGTEIGASSAFAALRDTYEPAGTKQPCDQHPGKGKGAGKGKANHCDDGETARSFPPAADVDPADRQGRYADIFDRLDAVGVDVAGLHLAWDFHVASEQNLAGRALAIRDDAFGRLLEDEDLTDLEPTGKTPEFAVTEVIDQGAERTVHGTVIVPNYLTTPQDGIDTSDAAGVVGDGYDQLPEDLRDNDPFVGDVVDLADEVPIVVPQSRFVYASPTPGPMDEPIQNPVVQTLEAEFTCKFRTDRGPVKPTLYGHGLLGGRGEVEGSSTGDLREGGHAMCGVDWIGMATEDITNVALILHDISFFASLADRAQQGFLNFMYVGRALIHEDGLVTDPAFAVGGTPILDTTELFYDGNSQGGIMGGALTALSPDFTKSVLGVPGMNYSTLLNRSVDWEGEFIDPANPDIPAYASFNYNVYPDKVTQQLGFALLQMLWDRAEANGYAQHMTSDPYANTPPHQVLLEVAFGDYQVTNHAAEVEARTIGAAYLPSMLAGHRHWERDVAFGTSPTPFGLQGFTTNGAGELVSPTGSAIIYWDSGNPTPFNGNVPPADLHQDPHSDPRKDDNALRQKLRFYTTGDIIDVLAGQPYWTDPCPRHQDHDPGC